jgi:eukaryotic-like serine/threonine-protein kinase
VRLTAASKLGPYEIVSAIGAGGMGEVYRARDPRLGRDVAIKVLPASFSADPDRLRRFELEARAAAALNHPNILAVHDVGSHLNAPYLVSELLEGETLRERLSQPSRASILGPLHPGPASGATSSATVTGLPVRRAIEYAVQIAHGLAAAHDKHLVHRDLKPENVFITTDGRVKILDFGLAKLTQADVVVNATELAPTTPALNTQAGQVLGTMGYMAPEQVRGLAVDHRTDIFAFGVMLYEMLSGQRAFQGATSADTITAILKDDPPDLPVAERHISPALERIVDRCLEKSPTARFQSATDLAFALESLSSHSDRSEASGVANVTPTRRSSATLAWSVAAVAGTALIATGILALRHLREAAPPADPVRFAIAPPANTPLSIGAPLTISPDGRHVVFGASSKGQPALWVRPLGEMAARQLPGTERATFPFWSPDSRSLGFFAGGKLVKTQLSGGVAVPLCEAPVGRGGAWNDDNTIVFASGTGGLQKVASAGGTPVRVTTPADGEGDHRWPWFLPDGRHFLYVASAAASGRPTGTLWIGSLDSSERTSIGPADSNATYSAGHVLFNRGNTLMAQPFDAEARKLTGDPFPIADQIVPIGSTLKAPYSVSASGVLGYRTGLGLLSQLTWFDRSGKSLGPVGAPAVYVNLGLSPDDRRLATSVVGDGINIWILDLARAAAPSRLTSNPSGDFDPGWSPDGTQVVFSSRRMNKYELYRQAADGTGRAELLLKPDTGAGAPDWSRDGRFVAFSSQGDVWVLPLTGLGSPTIEAGKPFPFLQTPLDEGDAAVSPDGRWMAYFVTEAGQPQIYVQAFPSGGSKSRISTSGGTEPRWRGDGKELFFLAPDGTMMSAGIDTAKEFNATVPQPLFQSGIAAIQNNHPYVVTRDGQRFLIPVIDQSAASQMTVVLNWVAGVQK